MSLSCTVQPTSEPVSLIEVKDWLRVDTDDENDLLQGLLRAARLEAEKVLRRQLMRATWRYTLDAFPCSDAILLPFPPVASVTSVYYTDANGTSTLLSSSTYYTVDTYSEPGRILLNYGQVWPMTRDTPDTVVVTFVAGYASAALVPESVKTGIKMCVAHWYEYREPIISGTIVAQVPMSVETLWSQARVMEFV